MTVVYRRIDEARGAVGGNHIIATPQVTVQQRRRFLATGEQPGDPRFQYVEQANQLARGVAVGLGQPQLIQQPVLEIKRRPAFGQRASRCIDLGCGADVVVFKKTVRPGAATMQAGQLPAEHCHEITRRYTGVNDFQHQHRPLRMDYLGDSNHTGPGQLT